MLACVHVVDRSHICQARSTNRITGCEGKVWSADRDSHKQAQDLPIRRCPGSLKYSEGSSAVKSEPQQRTDGAYEQSECITGSKSGRESEDDGVETNIGTEGAYLRGEQGDKSRHGRAVDGDHKSSLGDEANEENSRQGVHVCEEKRSKVNKPKFPSRMPPPSDCLQVTLKGTEFQVVGETLKRRSDRQVEVVSTKLGRTSRFGEGESVHQINENEEGSEKEPHLSERGSSHELFGERLDVVVSRSDERTGVQLGLSGSWGENLSGSQEQLSFQGEDTVECITNVGEEDDFGGLCVEDFQTPNAEKNGEKHRTVCPPELHAREELSQGGQGRHSIPGRDHRENNLRARAGSTLTSGENDLAIHQRLDVTRAGRTIPEIPETDASAGGGRQEKDEGSERRLRKSEGSLLSGERRVRARVDGPVGGSGQGEANDVVSKVVRPSRPSGGKDRHSKVNTAKGPRDRRVRLSVPTAVQFYDVQDRLGYDQPSKAVEWLIKKAKAAIDELGRLPATSDEGPSALSDINQGSPFSADLAGPLSGSSSCPPSGPFSAISGVPFADQIAASPMSYFIDPSFQQGMAFGNISHQLHARDVLGAGGMGLGQGHHGTSQGQLGGFCFPIGQTDPSRSIPGRGELEGGKPGELHGSPLARSESRVKARERARERVKEKCTGRESGKGDCSSPTSAQSPPLHQSQIHSSFPVQSALQSPIHSLSLPSPHSRPIQSSLSNVFNTTLSGIMQSPQQGTLQNLIMQSSSLQPSLTDQSQTSLQHPFQTSLHSALKNSELHQQSHLPVPPLESSSQRPLHLGPGSSAGQCSSSFSDVPCLPSDFISISRSLPHHQLSAYGIPQPVSVGAHFPTGNTAAQIPPGFSPGPPASSFRPCPAPVGQSSSPTDQQYMQAFSRQHCQTIVPSYSGSTAAPAVGSPVSKSSAPLFYSSTSPRMGNIQSTTSSIPHETAAFSSIGHGSMSYERDYQRGLQNLMMSPSRNSNSYESANSQLQMPARIQGLEDFEESPSPSSSHGRP